MTLDHSRARILLMRARQVGLSSRDRSPQVVAELVKADQELVNMLRADGLDAEADVYAQEVKQIQDGKLNTQLTEERIKEVEKNFKRLDADGDGSLSIEDLQNDVARGLISKDDYTALRSNYDQLVGHREGAGLTLDDLKSANKR